MEDKEGNELHRLDVAILKDNQKQGIGRAMITYVRETYEPSCIVAETDDDGVLTYKLISDLYEEAIRWPMELLFTR